jgi:hypothetical protein
LAAAECADFISGAEKVFALLPTTVVYNVRNLFDNKAAFGEIISRKLDNPKQRNIHHGQEKSSQESRKEEVQGEEEVVSCRASLRRCRFEKRRI